MDPDVVVIGGGVAGMAAAGELLRQGWRVRLIEARDRLGGRIHSARPPGWPIPVELGAEFIHGGSPELHEAFKRARVRTRPVESKMWRCEDGRCIPVSDYWEKIGDFAGRIPRRNHGWSFRQFLFRNRGAISSGDAKLLSSYVEGFNAAAIGKISALALRENRAGAETVDHKVVGRYDAMVRGLRRPWPARLIDLQLGTTVTAIHWSKREVSILTRKSDGSAPEKHWARAAVITLPLGVLQARRVLFLPALPLRQESLIDHIGWGQVVRIVVRFPPGFWSAPFIPKAMGANRGRGFGFINAPGASLPVWWALNPPAPVLTGWAGGSAAERIKPGARAIFGEAVNSLAQVFGTSRREVKSWITDWLTHDWRTDPLTLGAYSFPLAGWEDAAKHLAEPIAETMFFAGEALASDYGTVHGALESGRNAAQLVHRTLRD